MPLFLAEHSWEKEKTPVVMKRVIHYFRGITAGLPPQDFPEGTFPETVKLCATYILPDERAICIWEADKLETLEKSFKAMGRGAFWSPDFFPAKTKITPIVQAYPPSPDLYITISQLMEIE